MAAKLLQSCPTLCNPRDGSPPGSPVPGILQARTLEWVAISFSNAWKWKVKVKSLSRAWLLATPRAAAYQTPPSMVFSRQKYWSGVSLPSPTRTWKITQLGCIIVTAGSSSDDHQRMRNIPNVIRTFDGMQVTHRIVGHYKCFENTRWVTWVRHTRASPDTQDTRNNCIPIESPPEGNPQGQNTHCWLPGAAQVIFSAVSHGPGRSHSLHTRTTEYAHCKHRSPCGYSLCSATRKTTTVRSPKPAQRERPSMTKNERLMKRKESRSVSSSPAPGRQTLVCRPTSLGSAVLQLKQQSPHTLTNNDKVRTEWGRPHGFLTASQ